MRRTTRGVLSLLVPVFVCLMYGGFSAASASSSPPIPAGVGNVPQGTQSDPAYAASFADDGVRNVFVTSQQTSCYRPEVPAEQFNDGPNDGYTGVSDCPGATTGEDIGTAPYPTQVGSDAGFPDKGPKLVKDHSESDIRVDPLNPNHVIGSTKWAVSAEGYNHVLGFYESFDGGKSWPVQGHIPGYEGWTDDTDPVGAFDGFGNYYEALLPYQFSYDKFGFHKFEVGNEPNHTVANETIAVTVRPHGATGVRDWITTHNGHLDIAFATDAGFGQEPDKEWIGIDTHRFLPDGSANPNYNKVYLMWVNFNGSGSKTFVSTSVSHADGTHTDWTTPAAVPTLNTTNNNTYLLPHVDPAGVVYTSVVNYQSESGKCCVNITMDFSTDGGVTWRGPSVVATDVPVPPLIGAGYVNTTFRDGIENTFAVGTHLVNGHYPIYMAYETNATGFGNILLSASFDQGKSWTARPIQVNDNSNPNVDEFQPQLAVGPDGTVSVNFYDRRLACPSAGSAEAAAAGLALDKKNPNFSGPLPPFGAANYCINASVQFYKPDLTPIGHNIRLTQHSWDPQLNSMHPSNASDIGFPNGYGFIGDYFGNDISSTNVDYSTFVSTFDDGSNPQHYQQQVVATVAVSSQ